MQATMTSEFTRDFSLGELPEEVQARQTALPAKAGSEFAQFYMMDLPDEARTAALGRSVMRQKEMVRIYIPGDRNNIVERRVKPSDKIKYRAAYDAFTKRETHDIPEGHTALEHWPMLTRSQVHDLKYMNIFTVEGLAGLPDDALGRVGLGSRKLREHAQAFLETAKKGQLPSKYVDENNQLRNQVTMLVAQVEALTSKLEIMAVRAGDDVTKISNPVQAAQAVLTQVSGPRVEIPDNYQSFGLPKLKEICRLFTDVAPMNKQDAFDLISEYQGRRAAA